jgi:hypothetical protein
MKAPEPVFTSNTKLDVPSAIFLLIMLAAIIGILSTVAVASRSAYRKLVNQSKRKRTGQQLPPTTAFGKLIAMRATDAQ